jgi:hypothetical protein
MTDGTSDSVGRPQPHSADGRVRVPSETIEWLLEGSNPVVRAITLRDVLGKAADDPELRAAEGDIESSPWVRRSMRDQHPDGWWVNPKNCYQPRGTATVWHLQVLADLGMRGDDPRVSRACDRLLHPLRTLMLARARHDPRLEDALDLLESRADARLRWRLDIAPTMRIEAPGRASKWATASALAVLRHFGRL